MAGVGDGEVLFTGSAKAKFLMSHESWKADRIGSGEESAIKDGLAKAL